MKKLSIKSKEFNEYLNGFCLILSNDKYVQIQFNKNTNPLHADNDSFYAVIDEENDYNLNLNEEEKEQVALLIKSDKEISAYASTLE
jgi:hypothetical protein